MFYSVENIKNDISQIDLIILGNRMNLSPNIINTGLFTEKQT